MKYLTQIGFVLLFSFSGCSDNAIVRINDKTITKKKISCMRLIVFPPDEKIENVLKNLYSFTDTCPLKLEVSSKSGIVCNSNQNSDKKALSNFPSSYLRLRIIQEGRPLYSYYIDLTDKVSEDDVEDGFSRIENDLML